MLIHATNRPMATILDFSYVYSTTSLQKRWKSDREKNRNKKLPIALHTAVIKYLRPGFKFRAKIEMAFSQMIAIRS